jgi:hypothetical protein
MTLKIYLLLILFFICLPINAQEIASNSENGNGWISWKKRGVVSTVYDNKSFDSIIKEICRQSNVTIPITLDDTFEKSKIIGAVNNKSFWESITYLAEITDADYFVIGVNDTYYIHFKNNELRLNNTRVFMVNEPFCYELSRMNSSFKPDIYKDSWRLRVTTLPLEGYCSVLGVSTFDSISNKQRKCDLVLTNNLSGDIVKTNHGTRDFFFRIPDDMEINPFICKVDLLETEILEWRLVNIPIKDNSQVSVDGIIIRIDNIIIANEEVNFSYSISLKLDIPQDNLDKRKEYTQKRMKGIELTTSEESWIKEFNMKYPVIKIEDHNICNQQGSILQVGAMISTEYSEQLDFQKIIGKVRFNSKNNISQENINYLSLKIAKNILRDKNITITSKGVGIQNKE